MLKYAGNPSKNAPASNLPEKSNTPNASDPAKASALWNVLAHGTDAARSKPPVPRKTVVTRGWGAKNVAA